MWRPALDDLDRWVADAQVDEAISQRRRAAWLRRQDDEASTLAGVLRDLGERGSTVVVAMASGHRHRGRILGVGSDVVELRAADDSMLVLALSSVVSVRSHPGDGPIQGERPPIATGRSLASTLARHVGDRASIVVVAANGEVTTGSPLAVGIDVLTLRLDAGGVAYVPLASVSEVAVPESG